MASKNLPETYPSNSKMSPNNPANLAPEHKLKPISMKGTVIQRKKTLGRKLADVFIGQDVVDVRGFLVNDVLVPAVKNITVDILDGFRDSIELALFGTSRGRVGRNRYGTNSNGPVVSYQQYWNNNQRNNPQPSSSKRGTRSSPQDLVFSNNAEATEVLNQLCDAIETFGAVSVADLNDMLNIDGSFTDVDWGWTNLSSASVRAVRGGYLLDLPRSSYLK